MQRLLACLDGLAVCAEGPEGCTGLQVFSEPRNLLAQVFQPWTGVGPARGSRRERQDGQSRHSDK